MKMKKRLLISILCTILGANAYATKAKCVVENKEEHLSVTKIIKRSSYTDASRKAIRYALKECERKSTTPSLCLIKACYRLG